MSNGQPSVGYMGFTFRRMRVNGPYRIYIGDSMFSQMYFASIKACKTAVETYVYRTEVHQVDRKPFTYSSKTHKT